MTKGMLIAVGALMALGGAAFAAEQSGLIGSGDKGPGLLAADVSLVPGGVAFAQEAPAPPVLGPPVDCAPTGAGPEDTQQVYEDQGGVFHIIGTLSSFDAVTAVVSGPTGEITASLAQQFDLRGDLSPGSAVDLRGTIAADGARTAHEIHSACAAAGMIDCATAEDPNFQLHVDGDTFQVTGRLESLAADQVRVLGPGLVVEIRLDSATQVEGGLKTGDPVTVEGTVLSDRQLQALTVALRCQEAVSPTPEPAATDAPSQQVQDTSGSGDENEDQDEDEDCKHGAQGIGSSRLKVKKDGEARIKHAAVLSSDADALTVETPAGPVVVRIDGDTEVDGDLAGAAEVEVEGQFDESDDSVLAEEIQVLCEGNGNANSRDEGDEEKEEDDEDEGDKDEGGEGNGRGRGRGERNGGGGDDD